MAAPRRQFIDTEFGQMHVRVSRPETESFSPLICLHMSPQSGSSFTQFMTVASASRVVVAPDYHGFGESDLPPEKPHVTIQDYARTIWQALDTLKIETVDLLGHHTGSKVAAEMAYQHPNRVKSIVMISASVMEPDDFKAAKPNKNFDPIPLDYEGTRVTTLWTGLRDFCGPALPVDGLFKLTLDALRAGDAYQWANRAAFMYNEHFPSILKALQNDVTVFNPKDDLYEITPKIMPYLNNGRLIDQPNWEHGFLDVHTKEAVQAILQTIDTPLKDRNVS